MAQRFTSGNPSRHSDAKAMRRPRHSPIAQRATATLACASMFAVIAIAPVAATGCGGDALGTGRVAQIVDARTLRLDDGRAIRLKGLAPPPDAVAATAALAELTADRDVMLAGDDDAPDRHGRQHGFVLLAGTDSSVQNLLLKAGAAVLSGTLPAGDCAAELASAETTAREAGLGLWGTENVIKNAERPDDILAGTGRFALVEGTVLSARQAGATFYLNFGRRWTRDFAVIIPRQMIGSLAGIGIDARTLTGRKVLVRGFIEQRGGPRIELRGTGQIAVLDRH